MTSYVISAADQLIIQSGRINYPTPRNTIWLWTCTSRKILWNEHFI